MLVSQAKDVAREWVAANAAALPAFHGAFFAGSINWLADDVTLSRLPSLHFGELSVNLPVNDATRQCVRADPCTASSDQLSQPAGSGGRAGENHREGE